MRTCRNCHYENPDDAKFCLNCGFSLEWDTDSPDEPTGLSEETLIIEPPDTAAGGAPPAQRAGVYVGVSATALAVRAGGTTGCEIHVKNVGTVSESYRLEVGGSAATIAAVSPSTLTLQPGQESSALLSLSPTSDEPPTAQPLEFEVSAFSERDPRVAATARGTVSVTKAASPTADPTRDRSRLRRWAVPLTVAAAAIIVAVILASSGGGGTSGTITAPHARVRRTPSQQLPQIGGLNHGAAIKVSCQTDGTDGFWLKLEEPSQYHGDWVGASLVKLDGTPATC